MGYKQAEQNYTSATCTNNRDAVESQIQTELLEGRYVTVKEWPLIVSALEVIVKNNGSIRLIHDVSKPVDTHLQCSQIKNILKQFCNVLFDIGIYVHPLKMYKMNILCVYFNIN